MRLEKILLIVIFVGVCLALLMPFVVGPVLYSYIFSKAVFFQIIIELLIPVWIILILTNPKYRPRLNFITISLLIFFGVLFLSALFGIDFGKSFWGYDSRMNGIFTLLHFLAFFFIVSSLFKKEIYRKSVLFFTVVTSGFIALMAVLENFYEPFRNFIGGEERVIATLGNPIFLGSYLLFHVFLAFFLFLKISNSYSKILLGGIALINIFTLFLAETRGVLLALVFGMFFIYIGHIFLSKKKTLKILLGIGIFSVVVFYLLLVLFVGSPLTTKTIRIDKLNQLSIERIIIGTAKTRFLLWDIAVEAWKYKPILGWGPENFDIVYDKFYNPESLNHSWYETWGDKAHNLPLEILATSGILGFISYFLIFGAVFVSIYKIKDRYKIILAAIFVAYFIQNLFAFDTPSSLLIFFLLMAYVSARTREKEEVLKSDVILTTQALRVGFLCFAISLSGIIFLNIKPAISNNFALKSIDAFYLDTKISKEYFEKSFSVWSPYHDAARIKFANAVYISENTDGPEKKQLVLSVIDEIKKSAYKHPQDFSYPLTLGNLYASVGEYSFAYIEYSKALELSPKRHIVYFQYASAKFLAGEDDAARDILRQAVALNENIREPHWRLGLGLLGKDDNIAIEEAKKAIELGYTPREMEEINAFASVYIKEKEWNKLVLFYELLIKFDIEKINIYPQLAAAYLELGHKEKARDAALMAAELDQELEEETELFIQFLDSK